MACCKKRVIKTHWLRYNPATQMWLLIECVTHSIPVRRCFEQLPFEPEKQSWMGVCYFNLLPGTSNCKKGTTCIFLYLCNLLICLLLQKQVTYQDSAKKEEKIKHNEQTSSNLLILRKGAQTYLFQQEAV